MDILVIASAIAIAPDDRFRASVLICFAAGAGDGVLQEILFALWDPFEGVVLASMRFRFRGVLRMGIRLFVSSDAESFEKSDIDSSPNDVPASISTSPNSTTSVTAGVSVKDSVETARDPVAALASKRPRSSSY